jgi:hypothetical protein
MVADGLEAITKQLFSIEPSPWVPESAMSGAFAPPDSRALIGTHWMHIPDLPRSKVCFLHPVPSKKAEGHFSNAEPFVMIDDMTRPHILTRLKNRELGRWEFVRFRAEANAIVSIDSEEFLTLLPAPNANDYADDDADSASVPVSVDARDAGESPDADQHLAIPLHTKDPCPPIDTLPDAIQAIRDERFESAIVFLQKLVDDCPDYHVGWLRLGHAQREMAVRLGNNDGDRAAQLLKEAVRSLTQAVEHRDEIYRARALYERSKAGYRQWKIRSDEGALRLAKEDAAEAASLSPDTSFSSWVEFLGSS